jgi:transposase
MSVDQIQDIEVLRTLVKMQQQESARLKLQLAEALSQLHSKNGSKAEQLTLELDKLQKQHAAALKQLFGQKSERSQRPATEAQDRPAQTGHGPKAQQSLPLEEVVHDLAAEDAICDLCSASLEEWDGQFEESVEVDFIEPQVILRKHLRKKYRCRCGGCVKTAAGPKKLFPKARYSINFALHVALQKYCYHLPLERQARELSRRGLDVTSTTLWDYLSALYGLLQPAGERLAQHVLAQPVIGVDETSWRLLKSEQKGKSKVWWVWARRCDDAVHYTLDPSRSAETAKALLGSYSGTVLCDGYAAYESLARANPQLKLANCWAHARRELLPHEADPRARRALRVIQRLYALEKKVRGRPPEEILRLRHCKTRPLLEAFFKWIDSLAIPPTTDLRNALRYIQLRKQPLLRFLTDAGIDPDNNATERVIRGVVLGRKNHHGSRSERGTQVAALLYSLIDSAQLADLNPHDYLRRAVHAALDGVQIPLPHEIR